MTPPTDTDTDLIALANHIEELYEKPSGELTEEDAATVAHVIDLLDDGTVRVAVPTTPGAPWRVNEWAKKAVLLTFRTRGMETIECGPYEYHDKLAL
jgi:2,3,4,5-tetrahydropyridine-2-carboxylate N-succinyltransferase